MRRPASPVALAASSPPSSAAAGGPVLANPRRRPRPVVTPAAERRRATARSAAGRAARATTAPHDRLTEWWYYTGHLRAADGRRFGFEYVVFRAERGGFPVVLGVAPRAHRRERPGRSSTRSAAEIGPQVDRSPVDGGARLRPRGLGRPSRGRRRPAEPVDDDRRRRRGRLTAALAPGEASRATRPTASGSTCRSTRRKPPALHDGDGWVDFGPAGGSYYYSRTRDGGRRARSTLGGRTLRRRRATPGSTTSGATSSRSAAAAGTGSR